MARRYYYKTKDGSGWISVKAPRFDHDKDKIEVTEEEWKEHMATLKNDIHDEEE